MGVPVDYLTGVMRALELIGQGYTQTRACDMAKITVATFRNYMKAAPELQDVFTDAEQRGYDTLADVLLDIDNHHYYGRTDPKQQRVMSDNIKWFLARKRPSQYGDRSIVDHNHTLTLDRVIVEALARGAERAGNIISTDYKVLEHQPRNSINDLNNNIINLDGIPDELLEFV